MRNSARFFRTTTVGAALLWVATANAQQFEAQQATSATTATTAAHTAATSSASTGSGVPEYVWIGALILGVLTLALFVRRFWHRPDAEAPQGGLTFRQDCALEVTTGPVGVDLGRVRATLRPQPARRQPGNAGIVNVWLMIAIALLGSVIAFGNPAIVECHQTVVPHHHFTASDGVAREFVCVGNDLAGVPAGNSVTFFRGGAQLPVTTNVTSSNPTSLSFTLSAPAGSEGEPAMKVNGYEVGKHIGIFSLYEAGRLVYTLRQVPKPAPPTPTPTPVPAPHHAPRLVQPAPSSRVLAPEEKELLTAMTGLVKQMASTVPTASPTPAPQTAPATAPAAQPPAASAASVEAAGVRLGKVEARLNEADTRINKLTDGLGEVRSRLSVVEENEFLDHVTLTDVGAAVVTRSKSNICTAFNRLLRQGLIAKDSRPPHGCQVQ